MAAKFQEFDEYQLAKYNKAVPKCVLAEGLEEEEVQAMLRARDFTIKRLVSWSFLLQHLILVQVRLLHISSPANLVMGILGKK